MPPKKQTEKDDKKELPPVKIERFTQNLAVALRPAEIAERADRAAHLLADRDHLEAEFDEERKHQKAQIQKLETEMRRLSSEVREKVTYRDVDCERRFIYADKLVRDVRSDTGETLHERPMSEQESQRQFDFDKKSGDVDDEFDTSDGGEAAE